jgi:hypothetical protein
MFLNNYKYDLDGTISFYTSQVVLSVLVFVSDKKINFIEPCRIAAKIITFVTIFLALVIVKYPEAIMLFVDSKVFKVMKRPIFGHSFLSVFHLSSPIIIISLGYEFTVFLINKKKRYFLYCILYSFALYFSGTRANMLAGVLVLMIVYLYYMLFFKRNMLQFVSLLIFICFIGLFLIFLLLTDKTSGSSVIKHGHLVSMNKLFSGNLNIFLFGNGPGSLYYSEGFKSFTYLSEMSYYEMVRNYGLFSAVIICFVYFFPLIIFLAQKKILSFSIFISYLAYLSIAGTNPLLMVPQGYIVLILSYNLGLNINRNSEYLSTEKNNRIKSV